MILVLLTNIADYCAQKVGVSNRGEQLPAAMRSKAEIVVELICPRQFGEGHKEHGANYSCVACSRLALASYCHFAELQEFL